MVREFNLLDESWIRVRFPDCTIQEMSLIDVLLHSQNIDDLSGELPSQDIAIMRLLLAVLHSVFSKTDAYGNASLICDYEDALIRWEELWELKHFPEKPIKDYLEKYHDSFWLFDDVKPFYQVPAINGTPYTSAKLNGELSESNNKIRLFSSRSSDTKGKLTFAEAARWLLYINSFDDNSSKTKTKGLPSPGVGWLGKLGLITVVGNNLFESLMLNFILLKDNQETWDYSTTNSDVSIYPQNKPVWEYPVPRSEERKEVISSGNPAEFLTLQSRRLLLKKEGNMVTGYSLIGGDFYSNDEIPPEQMTIWISKKDGNKSTTWSPRRHLPMRQMWRDFSSIAVQDENAKKLPGVVLWIKLLQKENILSKDFIQFRISSVQYGGSQNSFVNDVFSDSLTFQTSLLSDLGSRWCNQIKIEIDKCDDAAKEIGMLSINLSKAAGSFNESSYKSQKEEAQALFYDSIDSIFRNWLSSIKPETDDINDKCWEWRSIAKKTALSEGENLIKTAGEPAFVGRYRTESGKTFHYSSSESFNHFKRNINKIYENEVSN